MKHCRKCRGRKGLVHQRRVHHAFIITGVEYTAPANMSKVLDLSLTLYLSTGSLILFLGGSLNVSTSLPAGETKAYFGSLTLKPVRCLLLVLPLLLPHFMGVAVVIVVALPDTARSSTWFLMEWPEPFTPSVVLVLFAIFTADGSSAKATNAVTGAAPAVAAHTAGTAASFAAKHPAVAASPSRWRIASAPPSLETAYVRRLDMQSAYVTAEPSVEEESFETRPTQQKSFRRPSAPARLETTETAHLGDSVSNDSYSHLSTSYSGSERTVDSATVSSSDGKSPFAEAGSWTEAWESWLHPAAILSLNATSSKGGSPAQPERRQQQEKTELVNANADEESMKEQHPPRHCVGCPGRKCFASTELVPIFDRAIVLPEHLKQNVLFNVTMDPGSVLLVTSDGFVCHEANPTDLRKHVYAANAAMDNCDFGRLLTWEQVFPLIPPTYVIWRCSGHRYFLRKPDAEFVERNAGHAFCFTLEDVETHKVATFVIAANGVDNVGRNGRVTFAVVLTVFGGLLSSYL